MWKEYKTDAGKVYFYNTTSQQSVWEEPEELTRFKNQSSAPYVRHPCVWWTLQCSASACRKCSEYCFTAPALIDVMIILLFCTSSALGRSCSHSYPPPFYRPGVSTEPLLTAAAPASLPSASPIPQAPPVMPSVPLTISPAAFTPTPTLLTTILPPVMPFGIPPPGLVPQGPPPMIPTPASVTFASSPVCCTCYFCIFFRFWSIASACSSVKVMGVANICGCYGYDVAFCIYIYSMLSGVLR